MGPTTWLLTHPPLSPTIPSCVQMFHWISTTRWDLPSGHGFLACRKTGLIWTKTPVTLAQPAPKNCLIMSHSGGEKEGSKLLVLCIACSTWGLLQRPVYGTLGWLGEPLDVPFEHPWQVLTPTHLKSFIMYMYTTTKTVKLDAYSITYMYMMSMHLNYHFFVYHRRVGAK
jgi:hypothetical protein